MYKDVNDTMVPHTVVMRDTYFALHYGLVETVTEILGEHELVTPKQSRASLASRETCLEPIDDDPTIEIVLAAYGF